MAHTRYERVHHLFLMGSCLLGVGVLFATNFFPPADGGISGIQGVLYSIGGMFFLLACALLLHRTRQHAVAYHAEARLEPTKVRHTSLQADEMGITILQHPLADSTTVIIHFHDTKQ